VLGGDVLLVVVTARGGEIVRADARACRSTAEAGAVLDAFLGAAAPRWAADRGIVDGADGRSPALVRGIAGEPEPAGVPVPPVRPGAAAELTVVLPFLPLDERAAPIAVAAEPAMAKAPSARPPSAKPPAVAPAVDPFAVPAMPAIFGGTMRPGAAFLDAPPAPSADDATDGDDEDARDGRDRRDRRDDADHDSDERPWSGRADASDDDLEDEEDEDEPADGSEEDERRYPDHGRATTGRPAVAPPFAPEPEPEPEPVIDRAGTLDRLRARTSAAADRVSMLLATDDGVAEHVADAAGWLADASEQELRAVARGGWTGDEAVEIALLLAEDDPEALEVVQLARRHETELVVEIDGRAAAAWLTRHRPETAERLGALL
jgi:hypothetical protein